MIYEERPKKSIIREFICAFFKKRIKSSHQLLTLETPEWLFYNSLPKQRLKVYQSNSNEFYKMRDTLPSKVKLIHGDLNEGVLTSTSKYSGAYLDYCGTYNKNRDSLLSMFNKKKIRSNSPFAVTFCTRNPVKSSLETVEQQMKKDFKHCLNHLHSFKYRDGSPMITMLFEVK